MFNYTKEVEAILGERKEHFEEINKRDFEILRPFVRPNTVSILDIGCGLGGVDILLANEIETLSLINIIEGSGDAPHKARFHDKTEPWGDKLIANEFISQNVKCSVRSFWPFPWLTIPSDLIISLKSWGHHYPVGEYIELVKRSLKPGGRVVMDLRINQDGEDEMVVNGFRTLDVIWEGKKFLRMVFER